MYEDHDPLDIRGLIKQTADEFKELTKDKLELDPAELQLVEQLVLHVCNNAKNSWIPVLVAMCLNRIMSDFSTTYADMLKDPNYLAYLKAMEEVEPYFN